VFIDVGIDTPVSELGSRVPSQGQDVFVRLSMRFQVIAISDILLLILLLLADARSLALKHDDMTSAKYS
jgi:hypothetical protein